MAPSLEPESRLNFYPPDSVRIFVESKIVVNKRVDYEVQDIFCQRVGLLLAIICSKVSKSGWDDFSAYVGWEMFLTLMKKETIRSDEILNVKLNKIVRGVDQCGLKMDENAGFEGFVSVPIKSQIYKVSYYLNYKFIPGAIPTYNVSLPKLIRLPSFQYYYTVYEILKKKDRFILPDGGLSAYDLYTTIANHMPDIIW